MQKRVEDWTLYLILLLLPASALAHSRGKSVLGSVQTRGGLVRINGFLTPSEAKLFSADRVETGNGQAVVDYKNGTRVALASESIASFEPAQMQLEKGLMSFKAGPNIGMVFLLSTLKLEPAVANTSGNATFVDGKASVTVTEGTLKIKDPSGTQLAQLNAGDARLFEEAPETEPAPAASTSPWPVFSPEIVIEEATLKLSKKIKGVVDFLKASKQAQTEFMEKNAPGVKRLTIKEGSWWHRKSITISH